MSETLMAPDRKAVVNEGRVLPVIMSIIPVLGETHDYRNYNV